jgi:hypothetical protein
LNVEICQGYPKFTNLSFLMLHIMPCFQKRTTSPFTQAMTLADLQPNEITLNAVPIPPKNAESHQEKLRIIWVINGY